MVFAAHKSSESSRRRREKELEKERERKHCVLLMKSFSSEKATIQQKREYTKCVTLIHPPEERPLPQFFSWEAFLWFFVFFISAILTLVLGACVEDDLGFLHFLALAAAFLAAVWCGIMVLRININSLIVVINAVFTN